MKFNDRKKLSLLMVLAMLFSVLAGASPVSASSYPEGYTPTGIHTSDGFWIDGDRVMGYDGVDKDIKIPPEYSDGTTTHTVAVIDSRAFQGNKDITSVAFPDSITIIPQQSFQGCTDLTTFTTAKMEEIDLQAFEDCPSLTTVDLPASLNTLGSTVFLSCPKLRTIKLEGAMPGHASWDSIDPAILVLTTSANLASYTDSPWDDLRCYAYDDPTLIRTAEGLYAKVDSGNAKIVGYDGMASNLTIPSSVTDTNNASYTVKSIGKMAFFWNQDLTSVSVPQLTSFEASPGHGIFQSCKNLKRALFVADAPSGIDANTFNDCAPQFSIRFNSLESFTTPIWHPQNGGSYRCFPEQEAGKYNIVVDSSLTGGTIQAAASVEAAGETVQLTVTPTAPKTGCKGLVYVDGSNVDSTPITGTTFTMPAADIIVYGTFYTSNGGTWTNISDSGWTKGGEWGGLWAMAFDNSGNLNVAQNNEILQYAWGTNWMGSMPPDTDTDAAVTGIAYDKTGVKYAAVETTKNGSLTYVVKQYNGDTMDWDTISDSLTNLGEIGGICVDPSNNLYVSDTDNNKIYKRTGGVWSEITLPDTPHGLPHALCTDNQGNLYAILGDDDIGHLYKYSSGAWTQLTDASDQLGIGAQFQGATGITVDGSGNIYAATGGGLYKLTGSTWSDITGDLNAKNISNVAVSSDGTVYVVTNDGAEVWKLQANASAYTVTFDKNGGTTDASPTSKTAASGATVGTLPTAPTKTGYTFAGWNTAANGSGTAFAANTAVNANITVYAQWTVISNSGSGSSGGGGSSSPATTVKPTGTQSPASAGKAVTGTASAEVKSDGQGKATAAVTATQIAEAVNKAVTGATQQGAGTEARVAIQVQAPADAKSVETHIPGSAIKEVAGSAADELTVSSPVAALTFDKAALNTISGAASGEVTVSVAKVDASTLSEEAKQAVGNHPVYNFRVTNGDQTVSQFGGSVTVSIPYTPQANEDPANIVVYYINAQGQPEPVSNCVYNPVTKTVTFTTTHFSQYAVGYNKVTFKDVANTAWYADAINYISARDITSGTGNGSFSPNAKLTRGQFLVMVMKAYGISAEKSPSDNFSDAGNTYYTAYLAAAKKLGITAGIGNNKYAPEKEITRQEMFTLLYNTLKQIDTLPSDSTGKALTAYSDSDKVATWAKDAVTLFVGTGTISGDGDKLNPIGTTTRAEMAQVLYNLLKQ